MPSAEAATPLHRNMPDLPREAGDTLADHLSRLFAARSVADAWKLHLAQVARWGFDRVLYSSARLPGDVGVLRDTLILSNHDHAFLDPFLQSGWWRQAVFLAHAETVGASVVPWRVTPDIRVAPEQHRILAFRRSHDITAGCTINFAAQARLGRAGMGLCARRGLDQDAVDAILARHGTEIEVACVAFHLTVSSLPQDLPGRTLTERQREVLQWVSQGKTVQDIARLMALTPGTVEKHLRLARAALGVQTTTQAVLKASFLNQMFRLPMAAEPGAGPASAPASAPTSAVAKNRRSAET